MPAKELEIAVIPLLKDNYGYLVNDAATGKTAAVDPSVAAPMLAAAKERGCMGPNGSRPAAQLRAKNGVLEEFDVSCSASVQRVRCDMGMCTAVR